MENVEIAKIKAENIIDIGIIAKKEIRKVTGDIFAENALEAGTILKVSVKEVSDARAVIIDIKTVVRYFPTIISLLVAGEERSVSRVPLSFSPTVRSIAG